MATDANGDGCEWQRMRMAADANGSGCEDIVFLVI